MKRVLIVNANYYKKISKNLVINAKKILINKKFKVVSSMCQVFMKFLSS